MAARGRGYFALYGYSENLKYPLLRKCQADIQIILQKHSSIPLSHGGWSKAWPPWGRAVWRFDFCLMAVERYTGPLGPLVH